MSKPSLILHLVLISVVFISTNLAEGEDAAIVINPAKKFQKINGWEATAQAGQDVSEAAFRLYRRRLFRLAVNDLGINRLRAGIGPGEEEGQNSSNPSAATFDYSKFDRKIHRIVIPMRNLLRNRREPFFLNVCFVDFHSAFNFQNSPDDYAKFVLATYQHLKRKFHLIPYSWEIILEPDNASWSPEQIANAIVAAGKQLEENGFTPRFVAPSTSRMDLAVSYFDRIIAVPGVQKYLWTLSYHRYSGVSTTALKQIASRVRKYKITSAMLEHIGSGFEDLHEDLKLGRCSAWQQYTLAYTGAENTGAKYYNISIANPNEPQIKEESRTRFLRQYFKFIRNGAIRIGAVSKSKIFDPLAFINKNGKYVVVIKAASGGSFSLQNLPAGRYGMKFTTESQYDVDLRDSTIAAGQSLHAGIPARGVITVYRK